MAKWTERVIKFFGGATQSDLELARKRAFESGMEVADANSDEPAYTFGGVALRRGYRAVDATPRDLSSWSQEKAIEASYRLWNTNPLAGALTEIIVDYVLGDGVTVTALNPDVQAALDTFLSDPVNDLIGKSEEGSVVGSGLEQIVRELSLFGEQLILAFVRDGADLGTVADGRLRIGTVDPSMIKSMITAPGNKREVVGVRLKAKSGGGDGPVYKLIQAKDAGRAMEGRRNLRAYSARASEGSKWITKVSRHEGRDAIEEFFKEAEAIEDDWVQTLDRETLIPLHGKEWIVDEVVVEERDHKDRLLQMKEANDGKATDFQADGECFLFQVNRISTGMRGRPDLLRMIDWLDRFDQLFFDGAEHVALLNVFSWDLTVDGGTETSTQPELNLGHQAGVVAKMKPGSVYAHNKAVELEAKNPDLKTQDIETVVRQLRILIAGGARVPEHWLGEGSQANRATAEVMGEPTFRMLTRRQAVVKMIITKLCQYQIDVLVALGNLNEQVQVVGPDGKLTDQKTPAREAFKVDMADINQEDTAMASRAFAVVAQAVLPLISTGFLPKKTAMELLASVAALLGVEIDVNKALEDAGNEPAAGDTSQLDQLAKALAKLNPGGAAAASPNASTNGNGSAG